MAYVCIELPGARARRERLCLSASLAMLKRHAVRACARAWSTSSLSAGTVLPALAAAAAFLNGFAFPFELAFSESSGVCFASHRGWSIAFVVADLCLWFDFMKRTVQSPRVPARRAKLRAIWPCLWECVSIIPYDWLASGSARCFAAGHLPRLLLMVRVLRKATELINAHFPAIDERRAQAQAARLALIVFSLLHWFACLNYAVAKRTIFTEAELGERSSQSELYLRALQRALCSFVGEVRRERERVVSAPHSMMVSLSASTTVAHNTLPSRRCARVATRTRPPKWG
jgi:hypothetical protein